MEYNEILKRCREKHGNKYEYEKFENKTVNQKMKIICPIHGEFEQVIYAHLKGQGCPKCVGERRGYTTEDFIRDAKNKFGDKFDYSKSIYTGRRNKVCIICKALISYENPTGEFWQKPFNHLESPTGMPFLGKRGRKYNEIIDECEIKIKTKRFIEEAKQVHGDKYDYSKSEYKGCLVKICIICPIHGEFWQTPNNHLMGHGCPKCAKTVSMDKEEFIEKARKVHGNKYDYSKVVIKKSDDKVCIICPKHGEFWQTVSAHLRGRGCIMCSKNKKLTNEEFIERAKQVHGEKYDYSKVEYLNNHTNVTIVCPKHGEFTQLPTVHLNGGGCPTCNESKLENDLSKFLDSNDIKYERQKIFEGIKYKKEMPFDFYLLEFNVVIECQGEQHFSKHHFFIDDDRFEKDKIKYYGCLDNKIKILYYTNIDDYKKYFNEIYTLNNTFVDKNKLLTEIKNTK